MEMIPHASATINSKNEKIARRIKKRSKKTQNKLESLISMSFTKTLPAVNVELVDDFPQFTEEQLKRRVIFGSYKLRMARSYIEQIHQHGIVYYLNDKFIQKFITNLKVKKELSYSRILAVGVLSKHARGKKWRPVDENNKSTETSERLFDPKSFTSYYKVFIQYIPKNICIPDENKTLNTNENPCKRIKRNTLTFLLIF